MGYNDANLRCWCDVIWYSGSRNSDHESDVIKI